MNVSYGTGIFLLCLSWCWLQVFAQQVGSAPVAVQLQPAPAPTSDVANHLVLDVVVADKAGKPVKGLERAVSQGVNRFRAQDAI